METLREAVGKVIEPCIYTQREVGGKRVRAELEMLWEAGGKVKGPSKYQIYADRAGGGGREGDYGAGGVAGGRGQGKRAL